jgi:hypothetical protein
MADLSDLLGDVPADVGGRQGARLREILELTIKKALEDKESIALLGPESLKNALDKRHQDRSLSRLGTRGWGFSPAAKRSRTNLSSELLNTLMQSPNSCAPHTAKSRQHCLATGASAKPHSPKRLRIG